MADYSRHQKKIIDGYYDNRDEIMLARLQEIVTELYLADTGGRRKRLWQRAATAMKNLKVPDALAHHILAQNRPEVLAENLRGWLGSAKDKPPRRARR